MSHNIPAGGAARDYYDEVYGGEDSEPECDCCGGEGFVELEDHPELWADDCLMEANRLVVCPECGGLPTGEEDGSRNAQVTHSKGEK